MAIGNAVAAIDVEVLRYEDGNTVVGQDTVPGLSAEEMQLSVENLGRGCIIPKLNEVIGALNGTYNKAEADAAIAQKMQDIGAGDMAAALYDPQNTIAYVGGIPAYVSSVMEECRGVTVTLSTTAWKAVSGTTYYTQTATVAGMTADRNLGMPVLVSSGNADTDFAAAEAWAGPVIWTTGANSIKFVRQDKPSVAIKLNIPGVM